MKEEKKKRIAFFSLIGLSLVILLGISYALLKITLSGNKNILMTVDNITLSLTEDSSNAISIRGGLPMSEAEGKAQTSAYKFVLTNTGNSSITYDLYLENDNEAQTACGNCELIDNNYISYELKKEGSVVKTGKTDPTSPVINSVSIKAGEKQTYELRVWLDLSADNSAMNKYYFGRIKLDTTQGLAEKSLAPYLVREYCNDASITTYAGGDKSKMYTFQQEIGEQQVGYTTEELVDYRYIGNVPNNYIHFNNEVWRIIGVFTVENKDGKKEQRVKIVRDESIGNYSWDNTTVETQYGKNDWSEARLMKLLNPGYESETVGGSLYWNKKSGTCYAGQNNATKPCDFTSIGLTSQAKSQVEETKWYLGGDSSARGGAASAYKTERGTMVMNSNDDPRKTNWIGNIGLLYMSDYGYTYGLGVDSTCYNFQYHCTVQDAGVPTNGWMHKEISQWLLNPNSSSYSLQFSLIGTGGIGSFSAYNQFYVYPVIYLKAEVELVTGTGTSSDPFIIR